MDPLSNQRFQPAATFDSLRDRGADKLDPIRFRFLEALARRAKTQEGDARKILDEKLAKALVEYGERFTQAQIEAGNAVGSLVERFPEAADELRRTYRTGDFKELRRLVANLEGHGCRSSLADLLAQIAQHSAENGDLRPASHSEAAGSFRTELKSVKYFRRTWSKLRVDQQLSQALLQEPENAGPLNSHLLVLRTLKLMRDISPDYLNRFMTYVDTLLWLEQADSGSALVQKTLPRGDSDKKRKSGRAKTV